MAFQRVPDTVIAVIEQQYHTEDVVNTMYFRNSNGYSTVDMQQLADLLFAWFRDYILQEGMSEQLTLTGVRVRGLNALNDLEVATSDAPVAGLNTSPGLPGNVAWCVKFLSGLTGRSARGRNYLAGFPESAVSGNTLSQANADVIMAAYQALFVALAATPYEWVIVSRVSEGVPRTVAQTFAVNGVDYTDLRLDSMRRRLAGRGS